ncbi:hypothetical protein DFH11DRAFT_52447 [Phellopilus nigrolimitatus]|nr:hypothetical protein DFH11DRAFT_52447 [Phellopilus nigrolimitatus]
MDPHFARLLSGLSSSAKKPLSNEQIESRPMSITPISGKSNSANPAVENMLGHSRDMNSPAKIAFTDRPSPSKESMHLQSPSTSSANSSFSSSRSNSSSVTVMAKSPKPSTFEPSIPPLSVDRHLKHLALLESVAQESAVSSSIPVSRSTVHPGLTSSVPPSFLPESRSIPPSGLFPSGPVHPSTAVGRTDPSVDDPFTVRPRTSQAVFPPSPPAVRRHGPNLSMHQGSLLSILSGPNGVSTHGLPPFPAPHPNSIFTRPEATPLINGNIPPPSFQHQAQSFVPQPPRVMPPPPGAFQLNPQPFPVSLVPTGQPSFPGSVMTPGVNNPHAPNRAHLLSLLNPNTMAGPTSILHADATRPNYPTGSPATATSMRPSSGVSNGIVHR